MADEYGTFGFGGVTYPLTASTTNTLLQDADPALYYALTFFSAVLTTHLNTRFLAEVARTTGLAMTAVVKSSVPYDPGPYLKEGGFEFPLLAVFPVNEKWSDRTRHLRHREGEWKVNYILPPLAIHQCEGILPILRAVPPILDRSIEFGYDPNVNSGYRYWQNAGIEAAELTSGRYGAWETPEGLTFPVVELTLTVKERVRAVTGAFDPLAAVDVRVDQKNDGDSTEVDHVADFNTDSTYQGD